MVLAAAAAGIEEGTSARPGDVTTSRVRYREARRRVGGGEGSCKKKRTSESVLGPGSSKERQGPRVTRAERRTRTAAGEGTGTEKLRLILYREARVANWHGESWGARGRCDAWPALRERRSKA